MPRERNLENPEEMQDLRDKLASGEETLRCDECKSLNTRFREHCISVICIWDNGDHAHFWCLDCKHERVANWDGLTPRHICYHCVERAGSDASR